MVGGHRRLSSFEALRTSTDNKQPGTHLEATPQFFVAPGSIVRQVWGRSETILFIFAGAAAEFALNKAVDWLYYTGKLPSDPLGRLFSTVAYARRIVFAPTAQAEQAIATMRHIHSGLEQKRGYAIPDWAYRDVLYMLIYYSIAAFELLERRMSPAEKEEVYNVFWRVGTGMGVQDLPPDYVAWLPHRKAHLHNDLQASTYTQHLFLQYRKHLGTPRYLVLKQAQNLVVPRHVATLLHFGNWKLLQPAVPMYKLATRIGLGGLVRNILLPKKYKAEIDALDVHAAQ